MFRLRTTVLFLLLAGALTTAPAAAEGLPGSEGTISIGSVAAPAAESETPEEKAVSQARDTQPDASDAAETAAAREVQGAQDVQGAAGETDADEEVPVRSLADEPESRLVGFIPSVALVRPLHTETELPAMQLSLGLVNFVGEVDTAYPDEDAFAILPLGHDAVVEVYELSYDGTELIQPSNPSVVREMGANEAYVLRVPYFAGQPTREICVKTSGRKHCWRPGTGELGDGFLSWKRTKGLD